MIDFTLKILLVLVMMLHIFNAPYTKVEESFNIQAAHDILYHGRSLSRVSFVLLSKLNTNLKSVVVLIFMNFQKYVIKWRLISFHE